MQSPPRWDAAAFWGLAVHGVMSHPARWCHGCLGLMSHPARWCHTLPDNVTAGLGQGSRLGQGRLWQLECLPSFAGTTAWLIAAEGLRKKSQMCFSVKEREEESKRGQRREFVDSISTAMSAKTVGIWWKLLGPNCNKAAYSFSYDTGLQWKNSLRSWWCQGVAVWGINQHSKARTLSWSV